MEHENLEYRDAIIENLSNWMEAHVESIKPEQQCFYAQILYDASIYCFARVAVKIQSNNDSQWLRKLGFTPEDTYAIQKAVMGAKLYELKPKEHLDPFASLRTFRDAFNDQDNIRCMRCKGNFSTCNICTCAAELLRNKEKKFSKIKRLLILKWRRKHLAQQAHERCALDSLRKKAGVVDAITQQPVIAFFMPGKII